MRVLILNPPSDNGIKYIREGRCEQRLSSFQYVMVPISLPSIAALLREKGHEVKILDCTTTNLNTIDLLQEVRTFQPALIILDVSTPTFKGDSEVARLIKDAHSSHITAIGTHVTALPKISLLESSLDSVIRGEPELTSLALADALECHGDLHQVEGLSFKNNGGVVHNLDRPFIENLNELPFPARDLIPNEKYTMPLLNRPYTLVITSRGCLYNCIFCTARQYYGRKLRMRSAKNIVDEIEQIITKFGIKDITMWSDTFTLNRDFVVSVCQEIKKRSLIFNWMTNSRVDRVDSELLKLMRESGCWLISYGVESGAQKILDNAKKGITLEQAGNAFRWSREANMETIAHIIFGLPGETRETIRETIDFVAKLNPDYAQFYCAIPFPGTEFYQMALEFGWLTTDDWGKFEINQPIISTPLLSAQELKKAKEQAFRSFYFRPSYIFKSAKKAKSPKNLINATRQTFNFMKEWVKE